MEVDNALLQAQREIATRFDFRDTQTSLEKNAEGSPSRPAPRTAWEAAIDVLHGKMVKRGVSLKHLDPQKVVPGGKGMFRQLIKDQTGHRPRQRARHRPPSGVEDQGANLHQEDTVARLGKNRDDLQAAIKHLRGAGMPMSSSTSTSATDPEQPNDAPQDPFRFARLPQNRVDTEVMLGVALGEKEYLAHRRPGRAGASSSAPAASSRPRQENTIPRDGALQGVRAASASWSRLPLAFYPGARQGRCRRPLPRVERHVLQARRRAPGGAERMLVGNPTTCSVRHPHAMLSQGRHSAYLKIAEGCNRTCSFCAIPAIRGKQRSVGWRTSSPSGPRRRHPQAQRGVAGTPSPGARPARQAHLATLVRALGEVKNCGGCACTTSPETLTDEPST